MIKAFSTLHLNDLPHRMGLRAVAGPKAAEFDALGAVADAPEAHDGMIDAGYKPGTPGCDAAPAAQGAAKNLAGKAMSSGVSPIPAAFGWLSTALQSMAGRGQTQISADALHALCRDALELAGQADAEGAADESPSVLSARVVYSYLKRGWPQARTRDKRDWLYDVAGLLDALTTLQN